MTNRLSREGMLMQMAVIASMRSTCIRKQVGAVIAHRGRVISLGYAGAPAGMPHCLDYGCLPGPDGGCIRTVHAEANAIAYAARAGIACDGATMYCTVSPCLICAKLIINAGIITLLYKEKYRLTDGLDLLIQSNIGIIQMP